MAKILLAKGARGELVRKVQVALTDQGFDPQGIDGSYWTHTETAVKAFQQARSLEVTGKVDVSTWTELLGIPIPTTQERALQLTAAFEGHGFTLAQGNWDGAGITWGIIGFTSRKLAIATGTGKVHGETFVLSNWGLDETLADS
jgi:peptidoglycan hydrolase-like protein with peptidoglycan-binding domain